MRMTRETLLYISLTCLINTTKYRSKNCYIVQQKLESSFLAHLLCFVRSGKTKVVVYDDSNTVLRGW